MPDPLVPGTFVWRKDVYLGFVDHYGIVVQSSPCFVANIDKSATRRLNVKIEPFAVFAAGRPVIAELPPAPVDLNTMWLRVRAVAASQRPFGLLTWGQDWNCESFARFVRDGIPRSTQADGANVVIGVSVLTGVVGLLAAALRGPKFDRSVGRYRDAQGRFVAR